VTRRRWALCAVLATALLAGGRRARAEEIANVSCTASCHGQETKALHESIHASALSCVDCHGGDPTAFRDKEASHAATSGFLGTPPREDIPALCDSCHGDPLRMHAFALRADQMIQYRISGHGRALFERGNTHAAVCSDCHGAHGILAATDPRAPTAKVNLPETCGRCHADEAVMQGTGHDTSIVARFEQSVHGRALHGDGARGAPSCADCHGSHGASPPGVGEVVEVCGRCHVNEKAYYQQSAHTGVPEMGCVTCHSAHDVERASPDLYVGDAPGHCGQCHEPGDEASAFAAIVREGRQRLTDGLRDTQDLIDHGKSRGLWFEQEAVYRRESERTLVAVRSLTHALDTDAVTKHFEDGLAQQESTREDIENRGNKLRDRKIILSVLVLVLLLMAGLLGLKLRAIRRLS
jgi:hypothetical protein